MIKRKYYFWGVKDMYNHEKESSYNQEYFPSYKEEGHCKGNCNKDKHKGACVEEILEAILKAQRKAENDHDKKCSSCDESFEERLEEKEHRKFSKNTIPVILYCGCEPFKGEGVTACPAGMKDKKFICITSFIFKVREIKGNCAELELLTFKPKRDRCNKFMSPCEQINHQYVSDLMKTGICITVDLSCFCAVTTLPAVRL